MDNSVIKRETTDKDKGKLLQKYRVILLLLQKIRERTNLNTYAALEYKNDVSVVSVGAYDHAEYIEGDKNYTNRHFSLMSDQVKNDLVICVDCWCKASQSDRVYFGFYTTVKPAKERRSEALNNLGLKPLAKPVLELLMQDDYSDEVLDFVKKVTIDEYRRQYSTRDSKGFLSTIEAWDNEMWKLFLERILWQFEQDDDDSVKEAVITELRKCHHFKAHHSGKEIEILAVIAHLFEERSKSQDPFGRLVNESDVENVFHRIAQQSSPVEPPNKPADPIWKRYEEELRKIRDKRDLHSKIVAVSPKYKERKLEMLARQLMSAQVDLGAVSTSESSSFQYRVFLGCDELIEHFKELASQGAISPSSIDEWISELATASIKYLEDVAKDFHVPFKGESLTRNTVLLLFEKCFLAFDEEDDEK